MSVDIAMLIITTVSVTFAVSSQFYLKLYNSKYKFLLDELKNIKEELNYIRQKIDFITSDVKLLTERISRLEGYLNKR